MWRWARFSSSCRSSSSSHNVRIARFIQLFDWGDFDFLSTEKSRESSRLSRIKTQRNDEKFNKFQPKKIEEENLRKSLSWIINTVFFLYRHSSLFFPTLFSRTKFSSTWNLRQFTWHNVYLVQRLLPKTKINFFPRVPLANCDFPRILIEFLLFDEARYKETVGKRGDFESFLSFNLN